MTHSFPTHRASELVGVGHPGELLQHDEARCADGDVGLAVAPRATRGVGDQDADVDATTSQDGLADDCRAAVGVLGQQQEVPGRSEEHTSELQSLMRSSYAVFCLKKKKKNKQ